MFGYFLVLELALRQVRTFVRAGAMSHGALASTTGEAGSRAQKIMTGRNVFSEDL